jgi:adenine-specific DNA-methyltransferase
MAVTRSQCTEGTRGKSEDTIFPRPPLWDGTGAVDLSRFPSTRYRGSKRKIIPWLWGCFQGLDFTSALDVFGGTGSVSYLLKRMGKEVTYNDYLHFNHLVGLALIENDQAVLNQSDIGAALAPVPKLPGTFVRDTFKGVYFTDRENIWIDNVLARINSVKNESSESTYKRALLHYGLFQSCLIKRPFNLFHRRNLYLRIANVKRGFGNKTTWDKSFKEYFILFCMEASSAVFKGARPCRAIRHNAVDIPGKSYDLVYIDPPYLTNEGDNETSDYRRSYHFLEGLCDYTRWVDLIDYETPNLRMKRLCPNDWIDPEKNSKAFDALFETFKGSIIVVSYKKYGVPSINTLIRMFKKHGRRVRSRSRHYKYALNHQNGSAELNREVLLIAE